MKAVSTGNSKKGMSTVEILIALAILTLTVSATIIVVFGNQSLTIDTQINIEAIAKAQSQLEEARALAEQNFIALDDGSATDGRYEKTLKVTRRSECQKEALSTVSWTQGARSLDVVVTTLVSDLVLAQKMGGDCASSKLDEWDNPTTADSIDFGGEGATDIDVLDGRIYITSAPSAPGKDDLYIYDFDPDTLTLTERSKTNFGEGFNAIDVIRDFATGELYAYALETDNTNQLRVLNVTDPESPVEVKVEILPHMTDTCPPTLKLCMAGISVRAYDGFLYVGTSYVANLLLPETENNELHIYDISVPTSPSWVGSENVNHNIYDIAVRDGYVYLALSGVGNSVRVYDVGMPTDPNPAGGFDPLGDEYSTALFLLDNKLYVGRERVNHVNERDFYILDVSDPTQDPLPIRGSEKLDLNPGSFVRGVVVRGDLAFLVIDDANVAFKILNIKDEGDIKDHTICTSLNIAENATAVDMYKNFVFTANRSNAELRVLHDQESACVL